MAAALTLFTAMALAIPSAPGHREELDAWKARRLAALTAPDGWLSVVGLFWLEDGANPVGSAPGSRVLLETGKAPARLGTIEVAGGRATFRRAPGAEVTADGRPVAADVALQTDADGAPTSLRHGSLLLYVIRRAGRLGVRLKDSRSSALRDFHGLEYYPLDPSWRIEARFEPYEPPKAITVPNVLGHTDTEKSPGAVVFERAGKTYRLDAVLEAGETDYFMIFGDTTNGRGTYGAGRFLYVKPPVDGKTVIDFNKAYNPPCVFTDFATCPLPPPQNRLPVAVEAGEKEYGH